MLALNQDHNPDRPSSANPYHTYLARIAPGSRRTMAQSLEVASSVLGCQGGAVNAPWATIRYEHVRALRGALEARYAPATANKILAAVKGVLQECWRLCLIDSDTYHRSIDVKGFKVDQLPKGRALRHGEVDRLFDACDTGDARPTSLRDQALFSILYTAGLRRAEAVALNVEDVDLTSGEVKVLQGKGGRGRVTFVSSDGLHHIRQWIDALGRSTGPLFVRIRKGDAVTDERLSDAGVASILTARQTSAGIAHTTPHDLRRSFATHLLGAGSDLSIVQKLMGHVNVATTTRYDRRAEAAKQSAVQALHVPRKGT